MTVVYCPRTHAFFRHETYPLARWLAAGVSLALGTDSRASNPDLNLFEEMKFVAARHPQVAPAAVLELGTIGAARALGLDGEMGSLAPGKLANFAVVGPFETNATDPHELLIDPDVRVLQTWMEGALFHDATATG
jgi:cytosine/adenosine deaminase-related metal-dependent hydrolase